MCASKTNFHAMHSLHRMKSGFAGTRLLNQNWMILVDCVQANKIVHDIVI